MGESRFKKVFRGNFGKQIQIQKPNSNTNSLFFAPKFQGEFDFVFFQTCNP